MRSTIILIAAATVVNASLWLWSSNENRLHASDEQLQGQQSGAVSSAPMSAAQCPAPILPSATQAPKPPAPTRAVDQPWLTTVRDNVLQLSLTPKFSDKVTISGVECRGSTCEITGSTKPVSDGEWHGSSDVASLMKTMNDGQIAGGDTGRIVAVNSIQDKPGHGGMNFSMTVADNNGGPPQINPCQSIFDAWKATHPEDYLENPDHPTIKNYKPTSSIPAG
jgi:hypothetical protein